MAVLRVSSPIAKWPADVQAQCGDVLAAEPYYFGFGADRMALMLVPLSQVTGGINDGVVSLHSAQWGRKVAGDEPNTRPGRRHRSRCL